MESEDIRVEISIKRSEFESALKQGMSQAELKQIYRKLKELQYQLLMAEVKERKLLKSEVDTIF
jgi:hypothetical protein